MKPLLLIADSSESEIRRLSEILESGYRLHTARDGQSALQTARQRHPDLIILDAMLTEPDGFQVCRALKKDLGTTLIPIIFLSQPAGDQDELTALELGAVDYITKPYNSLLLRARVKNHLLTKEYQDLLEDLLQQRTYQLIKTQEVTIKSLGTLAEYRDPETGGHIKRTQSYVQLLATELQAHPEYGQELTGDVIQALYHSAPLHDIGKVGVAGPYSPETRPAAAQGIRRNETACPVRLERHYIHRKRIGRREHLFKPCQGHGLYPPRTMGPEGISKGIKGKGNSSIRADYGCGRCV